MSPFPPAVLSRLWCPLCRSALAVEAGAVRCEGGHAFDLARQGYLHLLPGGAGGKRPDTPQMVEARVRFLGAGHFSPLSGRLAQWVARAHAQPEAVLEVGAGTGAYLARAVEVAGAHTHGIAIDLSKAALKRAARSHERVGAVLADVERGLPLRTGSVDVVMSVFAPRPAQEIHRVLAPGGVLLVAAAEEGHLAEVREPLEMLGVDPTKRERLQARLGDLFELEEEDLLEVPLQLTRADALSFALMGPSAFHFSAEELAQRVTSLPELIPTRARFRLLRFRSRAP